MRTACTKARLPGACCAQPVNFQDPGPFPSFCWSDTVLIAAAVWRPALALSRFFRPLCAERSGSSFMAVYAVR